jgi:hypothetical protein
MTNIDDMFARLDEALRDPVRRAEFERNCTKGCSCLYLDGKLQPFHNPNGCSLHGLSAPKKHPGMGAQ